MSGDVKMKISEVPRPFICAVIREEDPAAAIADMKLSECAGAQVFELNLSTFRPEHRNVASLRPVFRSTTLPIFTTCRRYGRGQATDMNVPIDLDDAGRMQLQLDLIDAGSGGFDVELDTFDPAPGPPLRTAEGIRYSMDPASPPREVSTNPPAVERQLRVVDEAHRRGGEVMASAHCLTRVTTEDVLRICRLAEERGCDLLKVVRFNQSWEDIVQTLEQTVALRRQAKIPYVMMAMGEYGKLSRLMSPLLGSMLCYCKQTYGPGAFTDQPLISAAKAVFENVDYKITLRAEEFTPEWYEEARDRA
jgi:hypothetical protein